MSTTDAERLAPALVSVPENVLQGLHEMIDGRDAEIATLRAERVRARTFRYAVETIRSNIFYWMTRNHNRGERSYAELGKTKEQLTAAIKAYDEGEQP